MVTESFHGVYSCSIYTTTTEENNLLMPKRHLIIRGFTSDMFSWLVYEILKNRDRCPVFLFLKSDI